jgi:metal-sulfur cluster biosynthetic enzyme
MDEVTAKAADKPEKDSPNVKLEQDAIRECIRVSVIDPEIGINVVDLGLLYDIEIRSETDVRIEMTLTSMGCPLMDVIEADIQRACTDQFGEEVRIEVEFVFDPPWNASMMSEDAQMELGIF